jgi:hypothetical protein
LLNLVVNVRDTPRVGDKLAILTRNIERDRARIHRMAQASQSRFLGPIANQGSADQRKASRSTQNSLSHTRRWRNGDSKAAVPLATHREGELKRDSLEKQIQSWSIEFKFGLEIGSNAHPQGGVKSLPISWAATASGARGEFAHPEWKI